MRRHPGAAIGALILALLLTYATQIQAQAPAGQAGPALSDALVATAAGAAQRDAPPATLVYANRPIARLRATATWGTPAERAAAAVNVLDRLVEETPSARVTTSSIGDAWILSVGARAVFAILPPDVNVLEGETTASAAAGAVTRLKTAFDEATPAHDGGTREIAGLAPAVGAQQIRDDGGELPFD